MRRTRAICLWWISVIVLVTACAGPAPASPASAPASGNAPAAPAAPVATTPKKITVAISGDPNTLNNSVARAGSGGVAGVDAIEQMVSAGMTIMDDSGVLHPQLGEAVPSIENGQWKVQPDGRMEMTWKINPAAKWHDGTPVSADDLLFAVTIGQDKEIPALGNAGYASIDSVEAVDARTVVVHWKRPFILADTLFTYDFGLPLPRHLLEKTYTEDKANFVQVPYWTDGFVGTGPYRLRDFVRSSHLILVPNDAYVLGRPKIDEIEIRFIRDPAALMANILAGEVQLTMGRGLSLDQAVTTRDQWKDGKLGTVLSSWIAAYPQMLNPTPAVIADARFRRVLLQAINRQDLVDSLQAGQSMVAHSYLSPKESDYATIERNIVKWEYDPRRAAEGLEALGYVKGSDGGYRDAGGQRLSLEIRTTGGDDLQEKTMLSISDYWQRLGITVDSVVVAPQRAQDREYRANFPSFEEVRQPNDLSAGALTRYYGPEASLPDNSYRGSNRMRYRNAELDALIDRFYATVPRADRQQVLGNLLHHMTDQVVPLGIFYNAQPTMIANRLVNVGPGGSSVPPAWNSHVWDLRP
jgi:peptide/nickel transport system substrate-binding protein